MIAIETRDLTKTYRDVTAVDHLNLTVQKGELFSLLGVNGAGKSTTIRMFSCLTAPTGGDALLLGKSVVRDAAAVKALIGVSPQETAVAPGLTVQENLRIGAYLRKDSLDADFEYVYGLFPRLKEREWQLAGTLSGGEQQMLAVARALMSKPKLIMMDEPSLGLAPLVVKSIFDIIKTINEQGITVLLIEQNANMALQAADTAYVLETGRITMTGAGSELLRDERIKEAYLGKSKKE